MAIVTRTVSINAAFLQEIKEDHHELRQLMHHTAAMLNRAPFMSLEYPRLADLFTKVRDQLAMHFSLEEAFGYFEDALSVAPHLARQTELLRCEHGQLYAQFCRLVERAEQLLYHETAGTAIKSLAEDYAAFSRALHDHEARENELILEAFNEEFGAGD